MKDSVGLEKLYKSYRRFFNLKQINLKQMKPDL